MTGERMVASGLRNHIKPASKAMASSKPLILNWNRGLDMACLSFLKALLRNMQQNTKSTRRFQADRIRSGRAVSEPKRRGNRWHDLIVQLWILAVKMVLWLETTLPLIDAVNLKTSG